MKLNMVKPTQSTNKGREISKRNFADNDIDDDDEESEPLERYSIEPDIELWKSIDFKGKFEHHTSKNEWVSAVSNGRKNNNILKNDENEHTEALSILNELPTTILQTSKSFSLASSRSTGNITSEELISPRLLQKQQKERKDENEIKNELLLNKLNELKQQNEMLQLSIIEINKQTEIKLKNEQNLMHEKLESLKLQKENEILILENDKLLIYNTLKSLEIEKSDLLLKLQNELNSLNENELLKNQLILMENDKNDLLIKLNVQQEQIQIQNEIQNISNQKENENNSNSNGIELKLDMKISTKSLYDLLIDDNKFKQTLSRVGSNMNSVHLPMEIIREEQNENEQDDIDDNENANENENDLPVAHYAAATGNMKKLLSLHNMQPLLLRSYDEIHRNPLFYAIMNNHMDIITYLLELYPNMIYESDIHGDISIHVACSCGNIECLQLLINIANNLASKINNNKNTIYSISDSYSNNYRTLNEYINTKNHMNMTPAHLTTSIKCLELLYSYECNLQVLDNNNRSPLFIACAMNYKDCAEFIIHCLEQENSSLLIKDSRGDTPLHAGELFAYSF